MLKRKELRKKDLKAYKANQRKGNLNYYTSVQVQGRKHSRKLVRTEKAVELVMGKLDIFTGKRELITSLKYEMVA